MEAHNLISAGAASRLTKFGASLHNNGRTQANAPEKAGRILIVSPPQPEAAILAFP